MPVSTCVTVVSASAGADVGFRFMISGLTSYLTHKCEALFEKRARLAPFTLGEFFFFSTENEDVSLFYCFT